MATDRAWDQRHLPIEGTYNFRDVGSYRTADGRAVRWRTLFRSDSLHRLTPAGKREVLALGVRSIIDLRSAGEIVDWPNPVASNGEPQEDRGAGFGCAWKVGDETRRWPGKNVDRW